MHDSGCGRSLLRAHGLGRKRRVRVVPLGQGFDVHRGALSMCKYASLEHGDAPGSLLLLLGGQVSSAGKGMVPAQVETGLVE
jgi:hypothetical protein